MGIFDELMGKAEPGAKEPGNGSPGSAVGPPEGEGQVVTGEKTEPQGAPTVVITGQNAVTQVVQGEAERKPDWKVGARSQWKIQRPRKYKSPEEFLARAQEYFENCVDDHGELNQPITITGMCNYLGTTRERLLGYENGTLDSIRAVEGDDERWRDAIKHAKHVCEQYAETHGFMARNPAFAIFALKNYGWKDTQTIETTTTEIRTIDPEVRQLVGEYVRQLAAAQKGLLIDVTPAKLLEPVKAQSGGESEAKAVAPVDNPADNEVGHCS